MTDATTPIINCDEAEEKQHLHGEHFGGMYKVLTPTMRDRGGSLGVNLSRVPPGRSVCPFHDHALEDEVFYILSGTGVLRYGDQIYPLRPGDCVSCPAGAKIAHQIANTGDVDLSYLAIGPFDQNEVCTYPDSDKVMVRSLSKVGHLHEADYFADEASEPRIFAMARAHSDTQNS